MAKQKRKRLRFRLRFRVERRRLDRERAYGIYRKNPSITLSTEFDMRTVCLALSQATSVPLHPADPELTEDIVREVLDDVSRFLRHAVLEQLRSEGLLSALEKYRQRLQQEED